MRRLLRISQPGSPRGGRRRYRGRGGIPRGLVAPARPWIGSCGLDRAGPPLPLPAASFPCSLFLRGHIRLDRKIFLSPAARQRPGGTPRRRPQRIAGGWTRGSRPGSVAPSRAVAASAARARSRREGLHRFLYGFIVRYIVHRPGDRVLLHELVRATDCQRADRP